VDVETLRQASERVERDLFQEYEEEVPSKTIGEHVLRELKNVDTVAYVRFASVYFEFETVVDFEEIISSVQREVAGEAVLR
jgi:transcriptional repressor NrdR